MSDKFKDIHESHASRKLNILKGFKEFGDLVKGHMDFGSNSDKKPKSQLVQKKITDRRGHQTTRWVKNGEDPESEKKTPMGGEEKDGAQSNQKNGGVKTAPASPNPKDAEEPAMDQAQDGPENGTPENSSQHSDQELQEFAQQLTPEQLQEFISNNEGVEGRERELGIAKQVAGIGSGEAEGGETPEAEVYQTPDGDTLESYYAMDEATQRSVLEASMKYNVNLGTAMAMISKQGGNDEEVHAKIDAAQAALDDLKGASGHPGSEGSEEGGVSDEQADAYDHMDIGQFSLPEEEWSNKSDEELEQLGRKIVTEQYGGDVGAAYEAVVANSGKVGATDEDGSDALYDEVKQMADNHDDGKGEWDQSLVDRFKEEGGSVEDWMMREDEDTDDEAHQKAMKEMHGEDDDEKPGSDIPGRDNDGDDDEEPGRDMGDDEEDEDGFDEDEYEARMREAGNYDDDDTEDHRDSDKDVEDDDEDDYRGDDSEWTNQLDTWLDGDQDLEDLTELMQSAKNSGYNGHNFVNMFKKVSTDDSLVGIVKDIWDELD